MQKEEVLLEQEAAKEEDEDNVEDYRPLGADGKNLEGFILISSGLG